MYYALKKEAKRKKVIIKPYISIKSYQNLLPTCPVGGTKEDDIIEGGTIVFGGYNPLGQPVGGTPCCIFLFSLINFRYLKYQTIFH